MSVPPLPPAPIVHPASASTIAGAVRAASVLSLHMARHLAFRSFSDADLQRAGVSRFLGELDRFTEAVHHAGPLAAVDSFTPLERQTAP